MHTLALNWNCLIWSYSGSAQAQGTNLWLEPWGERCAAMLGDLVSGKSFALSLPPASGPYSSSLLFHSKFELYEVFGLFLAKLPVPSRYGWAGSFTCSVVGWIRMHGRGLSKGSFCLVSSMARLVLLRVRGGLTWWHTQGWDKTQTVVRVAVCLRRARLYPSQLDSIAEDNAGRL